MSAPPAWIAEHLTRPRGAGELSPDAARGTAENAACGDVLQLFVARAPDGTAVLRFRARACSAVLATASLVCETLEGAELVAARALVVEARVREAGGLPPGRGHAVGLVSRALAESLRALDC
jgi:nitrogen fixation NifU-like protein